MYIYQYEDPTAGDDARWIAAHSQEAADAAARKRGWIGKSNGKGVLCDFRHVPEDRRALKVMGVDVIVKGE